MNYQKQSQRAIKGFEDFLHTSLETLLQEHLDKNPAVEIIKLFQDVATNVPAYQAFLAQQQINPQNIQNPALFSKITATYQR